ncbi:Hypothetical protein mma_1361 [Janthinobacterium sp. Marseille]|nr:Hypothetical protein mma_1361 [Janthinobacterium sp. Marseille]
MSIAVSAVVKQSRLLSGLLLLMCAGLVLIGGLLLFAQVGDLSLMMRSLLAVACFASGSYVFFQTLKSGKIYKIHISGSGQIRLLAKPEGGADLADEGELVELLPDSTLWPGLLLLRLQNEGLQTHNVVILPDSVSAESFRALLVACRWIVMRHADADKQRISGN